jgi:hypothetical protein
MKLFACPVCSEVVFFENFLCVHCGAEISFDPDETAFCVVPSAQSVQPGSAPAGPRACKHRLDYNACNWAVAATDENSFCIACRLNEIIPDLTQPSARAAWIRLEVAKRRLIYTLQQLELPLIARGPDTPRGLAFAFKQDEPDGRKVITGHADGLITINLAEADDAARETTRAKLGEHYRTVLGHFRHEVGHHYWNRLIKGSSHLEGFRELFGDERVDYAQALQRYYDTGAPADWPVRFISAYASAHPWEDWAETWAHYLHMVDGVETARAYGLALRPDAPGHKSPPALTVRRASDDTFDAMITTWMPVTVALNSFTRGMGLSDLYPFALSDPAIAKLRFVHQAVNEFDRAEQTEASSPGTQAALRQPHAAANPGATNTERRESA